jgi:hypothetical protein
LQIALDKGQEDDWFGSPFITALVVIAAVGLVSLVVWEWFQKEPIVDVRLFKIPNVVTSNLMFLMLGMALFGSTVLMPQLLQTLMGYTAQKAGMVLSAGALVVLVVLPLVGKLTTRTIMFVGSFLMNGNEPGKRENVSVHQDSKKSIQPIRGRFRSRKNHVQHRHKHENYCEARRAAVEVGPTLNTLSSDFSEFVWASLGMKRSTLQQRIRKLGITRRSAQPSGGALTVPRNSETFSPASNSSCVLQNGHATANAAVPRWHLDPGNGLSARRRNTNQ